jgi:hypothetical protein
MDEKNICSEFLNEILTLCCIKTAKFKIDFFLSLSFSSSYKISTFLRSDGSSETVFLRRNVAEHIIPVKESVCLNVVQIQRSKTCSNKEWLNGNLHTKMPFFCFLNVKMLVQLNISGPEFVFAKYVEFHKKSSGRQLFLKTSRLRMKLNLGRAKRPCRVRAGDAKFAKVRRLDNNLNLIKLVLH